MQNIFKIFIKKRRNKIVHLKSSNSFKKRDYEDGKKFVEISHI